MSAGFLQQAQKPAALVLGVAAAAGLVWLLFGGKIKTALAAAGNAVNPASDQNLAYRSVNGIGQAVTGRDSWALGSAIYDWFHEDANLASDRRAAELAAGRGLVQQDELTWYRQLFAKLGD